MKVFLVATEESGDRLGAALMQALKAKLGDDVVFRGVGGYEMAAEGLPSLFRIDDLAIVGLAGITQAFLKIPSVSALDPTLSGTPFFAAQLAALALFVGLGIAAARRFTPGVPSAA